jgi:hypothetical protein
MIEPLSSTIYRAMYIQRIADCAIGKWELTVVTIRLLAFDSESLT